jgi:hypothetical protein
MSSLCNQCSQRRTTLSINLPGCRDDANDLFGVLSRELLEADRKSSYLFPIKEI